jgi:DMSO/TMAO reductase YedYZ molybdopterin-dependent catalytic subunit
MVPYLKSTMRTFQIGSSQSKGKDVLNHILKKATLKNARLVEKPLTIKFKDLVRQYDQITCPVTLVCAGNRRKEQNVVRKTKGFSWGAAGVSNALWTGVMLHEILKKAGLKRGARYVCMEGADKLVSRDFRLQLILMLIKLAQWVLWYFGQAQLGTGS